MRYIFRRAAASRDVLVTVRGERARVVHFTFHILRRTAGGRRLGNVAEGPHSFRIKQRRRRRGRRRRRRRRRSDAREPRSAHRTRCALGEISLPLPCPRHHQRPSHTNHHQSPAHPRAVHGVVTENRLRCGGG